MKMIKSIVETEKAPSAIGPYSQAVKTDTMVFVSGQLAFDPISGELLTENIQTETRQAIKNLKTILESAGSGIEKVVKTTLFIKNMDDFPLINDVYAEFFKQNYPARACVEVARLPRDANFEIEAIGLL
jgi:2-iminobutanoate/2-iminopropanoate deaminase